MAAATSSQSASAPAAMKESPSVRQLVKNAPDYFALARVLLAQARGGDAAAEYALWALHVACYESRAHYLVQDKGHAIGWSEAIQKAARLNLPIEEAKKEYDRCHSYFSEDSSDLGDAMEWLQRATDASYAPAQAQTANLRLLQDQLKSFERSGAVPTGYGLLPPIGGDANPRDLLRSAVTSLDPDVIQQIGELVPMLNPSESPEASQMERAAWIYVACERGADCSAYGEPDMGYCTPREPNCVGVPEVLLEMTDNNWIPVRQRADEINAKLNAHQWNELGLGPS
jgi:hypothetical protein